jgi:hypothetical protein
MVLALVVIPTLLFLAAGVAALLPVALLVRRPVAPAPPLAEVVAGALLVIAVVWLVWVLR